jgi:D-aminopeptidase
MTEKTCWESFKIEGGTIIEHLKTMIREGNVRRVVIEHQGKTVAEFPLTAGVLGIVVAPVLAAIGALVALLKECTIHVERVDTPAGKSEPAATTTP